MLQGNVLPSGLSNMFASTLDVAFSRTPNARIPSLEAAQLARKLLIMLVNTDPRNGEELGAPFFQASVAAAMDYEVEVVCTATAGRLMKKGVAESLVVKEGSPKTVYDFIKEAHEAGVKFLCCSPNLDLFDMTKEDLIPECAGIVGGAYVIEEVMENDDTKVLSY